MADKKIRFSAEENVSPIIDKLKRSSEELGRGLIRDARAYTTSGKESLSFIEGQIKAIERRTRAEKQGQIIALEAQKQRGEISPSQFKKEVSGINLASKEDTQQVVLLRELIETTKMVSKREIVEDRKGVEKQLRKSKTVDELVPRGDAFKILKETLQRQQLGDVKDQEREEREKFTGRGIAEKVSAAGSMVAGSQNQFYMAAAIGGMIPIIGGAVSSLMQRAFSSAEAYQTAEGGLYAMAGKGGYYGRGGGMAGIGMTKADFLQLNQQVAKARGGVGGSYDPTKDISYLRKGAGIDQNILLEQERLTRAGGLGAMGGTQRLMRGLQAAGIEKDQGTIILSEYLPLLVNLQQEQLKLTSETNNEIATNLVVGIANLDDSFKNADALKNILPSIMQGLRTASTPQVEALQYRALSMMPGNQGKSLLELEMQRENPTLGYLGAQLNLLKGISVNEDAFTRNIAGEFGMSLTNANLIAKGYDPNKKDFGVGEYESQLGLTNIKGKAYRATGSLEAGSAAFTQTFETVGNGLTNVIEKLIEENLPEGMKSLLDGLISLKDSVGKLSDRIGGFFGNDSSPKIAKKIQIITTNQEQDERVVKIK